MTNRRLNVVGLGEILWDMLPEGKKLGGAPANFAYISTLLGDEGVVASRVAGDNLGNDAIRHLDALGVTTEFVQRDPLHPTGTVQVEVDRAGQPKFQIAEGVAWDFLEWTQDWKRLAATADAICFGSLAQRAKTSRSTICQFLTTARKDAVRIFDVNLRQAFFTAEILAKSMKIANIVKLNHEELPKIMELFGLERQDEISSSKSLLKLYDLSLICVTRGSGGSLLMTRHDLHEHPGYRIQVMDAIGAGDAFTAGLVHEYLRGASLPNMNETANRVGAWVASRAGAMPSPGDGGVRAEMSKVG